jgi:hypothetical protein
MSQKERKNPSFCTDEILMKMILLGLNPRTKKKKKNAVVAGVDHRVVGWRTGDGRRHGGAHRQGSISPAHMLRL